MGKGKKKKSITQMTKMQETEKQKRKGKSKNQGSSSSSSRAEPKNLKIVAPSLKDTKVKKELESMKVLTPYIIASRFNLRLSVAKDFLEELHALGIITYVSGRRNIRIYKPSKQ